ncbi:Dps family protein [Sphingobacterium spiritivorum]|uniref:Dps family protein n=1 Tax=Sphingobacterium spiritivorum TaxID=258 RepID=UPI00191A3901|nr:DNA starvation/stationary phase protection protein [Sphingobacterium spiritivorum]QQT25945.1 DNA starvation/stationary phase protection protein [Sphingobacterium spiritivorum]
MKTNIGIKSEHLEKVAQALNILLADETVLYVKTRNAHWNIEGSDFHAVHLFFEEQYNQLSETIDDIAERIRSLGHYAVGTMKQYLEIAHLSESTHGKNDSKTYMKELLGDHESIIMYIRGLVDEFEEKYGDSGSSDFVTALLEQHEKMAWMLRSHLS